METIKLLVVGDGNVGKTSLILAYTSNHFPNNYVPTVLENYPINLYYQEHYYRMEIWDTAGQESYSHLRPLAYTLTNVFLICFSIDKPSSFSNVENVWFPEVRHFCPDSFIILVGTKADLRDDEVTKQKLSKEGRMQITFVQGRHLASRIGAKAYFECSALNRTGLKEIFECVVSSYIKSRCVEPRRKRCSIL